MIFASVLSDAYMDRPHRQIVAYSSSNNQINPFDYKYGWSFFTAGAAFIMVEIAALLSMTAYLRRFPTVEDMVRVMVPGAERHLKQGSAGEYLVHHGSLNRHRQNGPSSLWSRNSMEYFGSKSDGLLASDLEDVEGPLLLTNTAPDICTTNPTSVIKEPSESICNAITGVLISTSETTLPLVKPTATDSAPAKYENDLTLTAVTVPIPLMHQQSFIATKPSIATDTTPMPTPFLFAQQLQRFSGTSPGTLVHQGMLGVSEGGASTSSNSSGGTTIGSIHCSISKYSTLPIQHKRRNVTISTFNTLESPNCGTWSNSKI